MKVTIIPCPEELIKYAQDTPLTPEECGEAKRRLKELEPPIKESTSYKKKFLIFLFILIILFLIYRILN